MNEMLQQFHFLRPWWLLALLLLPVLYGLGLRQQAGRAALSRLVDAELLPHLLQGRAGNRQLPVWLFLLGWSLSTLALAGPTWSRVEMPLYANRAAQVVAISLSRQMQARDVAPSRLDRARYKAHQLLISNRDGLNALVAYAGEAFVVAPLTSDARSLDDLLDALAPDTMPVDGDNAAAAIERGVALIHDGKADNGSIVLITNQAGADAEAAARKALAAGVRVSVLGVGTPHGGPVPLVEGSFLHDANGNMILAPRDDTALSALAKAGGGRYQAMTTDHADVDAVHAELRAGKSTTAAGQMGEEWQDRGPWLLLPLLLIVAMAFRRGWLLLLPWMLLPLVPGTATAGTWQDLWQRPDQQAAKALQQGQPQKAQQLAHDPAWRGAAAYRAGDYAAAEKDLQQSPGSDGSYNLGNALAKQQQYQQAIKAYDQALKLDPANADAKANRQAIEDWLKQHKHQQQSSDQQHEGHDGDKNQPSSGGTGKQGKSGDKDQQDQDGDKSSAQSDQQKQSQKQDSSGQQSDQQNQPGKNQSDEQGKPPSAEQQAEQKAQAEKAQQALKQQMDQQLADQDKGDSKEPTHQLGAMQQDDPQSKLPADVRSALQRVPDDPGALLRRKFRLEYMQRHGGAQDEDQ